MSVYDVSQWQPISRIKELAESGNCQGVILKLGEPNDEYDDQLDPHFEEFLEEVHSYLTAPRVVGETAKTLEQPNLSKVGGGNTPSQAAKSEDIILSYRKEIF